MTSDKPRSVTFTLCSGRSGTLYLSRFFKVNAKDTFSTHEPYLSLNNPVMFAKAIAYASENKTGYIENLLIKKKGYIQDLSAPHYIECNHAFLKSMYISANSVFPDAKYIHMVRNPLRVAKSEMVREKLLKSFHLPLLHYRHPETKEKLFNWSLTGYEEIFSITMKAFTERKLQFTPYHFYLLQWIEIERRAVNYIGEHSLQERVFFLDIDKDLGSIDHLRELADFLGIQISENPLTDLPRHKTPFAGNTLPGNYEKACLEQIKGVLPADFLQHFKSERYKNCEWLDTLVL